MKIKIFGLLAVLCALTLYSFRSYTNEKVELTKKQSELNLDDKKAVLVDYYVNLIEKEIERTFEESENGEINEKEMIANLVLLTKYGCAYRGSGCNGKPVCGVSKLWAETFGSGSWAGEGGGVCEEVKHK